MLGRTVSHYNILEKLGEGGMGEVFLAEDISLKRRVALKFLPVHLQQDETARKRFLREAESAAALEHPYICNIKEVAKTGDGQDFIVMEYVEGRTLRERLKEGRLPLQEALRVSIEVADGLALAHQKGVVHRDLKPANIMITRQGHAKVMDFGLAKRVFAAEKAEGDVTTGLTREGTTLGTPAYMSPEQVRAELVDQRSDLFSFGVVLYEMLTGVNPFRRGQQLETVGAILLEEPTPVAEYLPDCPSFLQETLRRLLAKDPTERIQTAAEVVDRLSCLSSRSRDLCFLTFLYSRLGRRWLLALGVTLMIALAGLWALLKEPAEVEGPLLSSIAVLPFENFSGDGDQEYFVDGMTEALITDLSKIRALKVISRSSAMRYKGTQKPPAEIARELGVEALLGGSVQREGGRVRISTQLIEAKTERNLWAESYERNLSSILALQSEVARTVALQIRLTLEPQESALLKSSRTVDPEAYEACLKGSHYRQMLTETGLDTAERYFILALEKDPEYAEAWAKIASVWVSRQQLGFARPDEAFLKAKEAVSKALELDDTEPEAHRMRASILTWGDGDWVNAEREWRRTLELSPGNPVALSGYSHFLMHMKRTEEAMDQIKRALELDPFSARILSFYAIDLMYIRRYDDAIKAARSALSLQPDAPLAKNALRDALFLKGAFDEVLDIERERYRQDVQLQEQLELGYAEAGYAGSMKRLADALAARQGKSAEESSYQLAILYHQAGAPDHTFKWLERARDEHNGNLPYVGVHFGSLRGDPRYRDLLRRMNFPSDVIAAYLSE